MTASKPPMPTDADFLGAQQAIKRAAQRAREIGLINYVVPQNELDAKIDWLVGRLKENSPVAIRRGKQAIATMEMMNFHEAIAFAESQIMLTAATDDGTIWPAHGIYC